MQTSLASWQNPSFVAPLGHAVSADAPSGIVHDLPVPVQLAATSPELALPARPPERGVQAVVSRAVALFGPSTPTSTPEVAVHVRPPGSQMNRTELLPPAVQRAVTAEPGAVTAEQAVQRLAATEPPAPRFTSADAVSLPVVSLPAVSLPTATAPHVSATPAPPTTPAPSATPSATPAPSATPSATSAPSAVVEPDLSVPTLGVEPDDAPPAIQRATEPSPAPSTPEPADPAPTPLNLAHVQRNITPGAGRRLGLGPPLVPSEGPSFQPPPSLPAAPSAQPAPSLPAPSLPTPVLPAPASEAGVSGDEQPASPPPVSADAPGTPHGNDEPSEVTSLLGDSPLVQRSVGEPDDFPGEPGTTPPVPEPTLPVASSSPAPIPGDQPPIVLRSATAESAVRLVSAVGLRNPTAGATPGPAAVPSPTVQRATTLPLAAPTSTAPAPAQAQAPPAQAQAAPEPAPALVVARLIGDRSLPLRAAPEPDQGASTSAHPAATVQRWPDPYGIATTPSVQRTAALPSSRNALAGDVAGAPAAAAMASGWIVPPGTEPLTDLTLQLVTAPIPGLPLQRAHAAPGAPQPGWSPGTPVGPVATPAVQRVVETQAAPVQIDFTSGVPVVSREAETPVPDAPEPPAAAPAAAPSAPTSGQATAAPAAPAPGGGTPEELLAKIFDPLLRRLKTELRLDRERHGSLTDLRH